VASDMQADALIRDYLGRLQAASWPLPAGRRAELSGEVAEHIEAALAEAGRRDEVTVRNVLERLGPPEEIVAAEAGGEPDHTTIIMGAAQAPAAAASPWGAVEIMAILFLTAGAVFIPIVGPVIGLVFTAGSGRWTTRQKLVASTIVLASLPLAVLVSLAV